MGEADRAHWDSKWRNDRSRRDVSGLLVAHEALLRGGTALDVACGVGQNTLWLAQHRYCALGVDLSREALRRAVRSARRNAARLPVMFAQVDLDVWRPPPASVDLICVLRFLDRALLPALRDALRPDGLLFYATRHEGLLDRQPDATRAFLLRRGELAQLFSGWEFITYREGRENAAIVARKPA